MSQRYFLGIDGGASKTIGVLIDEEGHLLASARVGGSSIIGAPVPQSCETLSLLKKRLCIEAQVDARAVTGIGLGLNGIDFADEFPLQHTVLSRCLDIPAADLSLVNDGIGALWGASPAEKLVIVQYGTACTTAYRSAYGDEHLFDHLDAGGIFDIRRALTRVVARMIDGREDGTPLQAMALKHYGVSDETCYAELLFREKIPYERIMTAHTLVFTAWQAHDPAATRLVELAADDFAGTARAMVARIGDDRCQVAFGGGVIDHAPEAFLALLAARVHAAYPATRVIRPLLSPAYGAALMTAFYHGIHLATCYAGLLRNSGADVECYGQNGNVDGFF